MNVVINTTKIQHQQVQAQALTNTGTIQTPTDTDKTPTQTPTRTPRRTLKHTYARALDGSRGEEEKEVLSLSDLSSPECALSL
jgi:hypothetical protein